MGEIRNTYRTSIGKSDGERCHRRPWCKWENNIKIGFREIEFGDVDWIHLAQDSDWFQALVNTVTNP
jgi:hypothetical protein